MILRTILFFISITVSFQSAAAVVEIVFDIESNQRLLPFTDGDFINYNTDHSYINEQFQITFRLDSNSMSYFGSGLDQSAQYDNPVVTDNSLVANDISTFQSPAELITSPYWSDLFAVSQHGINPINENVYAATNTVKYLITTDDDTRFYQSYINGLSLIVDETNRNNQGLIENHNDFMSLLDYMVQNSTEFRFSNMVEYSESTTYLRGAPNYTFVEGVIYEGTATISSITTVPVPAAVWLFGSGLMGFVVFFRRSNNIQHT